MISPVQPIESVIDTLNKSHEEDVSTYKKEETPQAGFDLIFTEELKHLGVLEKYEAIRRNRNV